MRKKLFCILIVLICLVVPAAFAGNPETTRPSAEEDETSEILTADPAEEATMESRTNRIHIVADRLEAQRGLRQQAEFSGNVRAIGDAFDISADSLIVVYAPAGAKSDDDVLLEDTFDKIIATGNVTIRTGESIAKAEKAVYDKAHNMIILTGENTLVTGESGYVSGSRITINTENGVVSVESGTDRQVEAVIDSRPPDKSRQIVPEREPDSR